LFLFFDGMQETTVVFAGVAVFVIRYPPPDKQLAMAVDIIRTFPLRASKCGRGHVSSFDVFVVSDEMMTVRKLHHMQ
jgi:hypothetical protein